MDDDDVEPKNYGWYLLFSIVLFAWSMKSCVEAHWHHKEVAAERAAPTSTNGNTSTVETADQTVTNGDECQALQRKSEDEMVSECDATASSWTMSHAYGEGAARAACYANVREQLQKCGMPTGLFDWRSRQ